MDTGSMRLDCITHQSGWLKTKYEQLIVRKSTKKTLKAIARKLLIIIWHVLTKQQVYIEFVPKLENRTKQKRVDYYQKKINELENN